MTETRDERVHRLFGDALVPGDAPDGPPKDAVTREFLATARAISAICATRILLLIAVIAGTGVWGATIYDPSRDRLYAAIAFSLVFVLPQVVLYYRKG